MPRYFFDTIDGQGLVRDHNGLDLANDEEARRHGLQILPDMARNAVSDVEQRLFTIVVRDDVRMAIYTADLNLAGRWLKEPM